VITIAEYVEWKQPLTLDAVELKRQLRQSPVFWWWARLMQERPLPGRAGLLPGEKAV